MKNGLKFLIFNVIYVIAFSLGGWYTYDVHGLNTDYFRPLLMSFILGLFMFNLIGLLFIVLGDGILNSGDVR